MPKLFLTNPQKFGMRDSIDLTKVLWHKNFPQARCLTHSHWSTFALKKAIFFSNLFWFALFIAVCAILYFTFLSLLSYQKQKWEDEQQLSLMQQDIYRLQEINFYTSEQMLALATKIQTVVDSAQGPQRNFLMKIVPEALRLQISHQIPASATISMAIYESRYGQSNLATSHNNFFGIKALDPAWEGPKIFHPTRDNGKKTMAYFRVYGDLRTSLKGYADFLKTSSRYANAFEKNSGEEFVQAVLQAGYCPDADYLSNIQNIMKRHHLTMLDLPQIASTHPTKAEQFSLNYKR